MCRAASARARALRGARLRLALALLGLGGCSGPAEESGAARPPRAEPCEGLSCRLAALEGDGDARAPDTGQRWRELVTRNFRVLHFDDAAAWRVGQAAERVLARQLRRWRGPAAATAWSPRCDLYLYPTTQLLVRLTGGSAKSGSAIARGSELHRGQVLSRRLDLAADDRELLGHTLPHEISHVLVTELVARRRVPQWAHEGLAVLEEPAAVHRRYVAVVARHVAARTAFSVQTLLTMTRYPDAEWVTLYYGQSLSLTRFFLARGSAAAFLEFLRAASDVGAEAALRQHYQLSWLELQARWLDVVGAEASPADE